MKFKITGDNLLEVDRLLEKFCKVCEKEYTKQIKEAREKLKHVPLVGQQPLNALPDFLAFAHINQKDHIVFMNSLVVPFFVKKQVVKNTKKNLEGFLKDSGCKNIKIEYIGD